MMGPSYNTIFVGEGLFTLIKKSCKVDEISDNSIRISSVSFVKNNLLADREMCTDDPQLAPILKDMKTRFPRKRCQPGSRRYPTC